MTSTATVSPSPSAPPRDTVGFYSSGTSPTAAVNTVSLHLIGVGHVGQALLRQLPEHCRLVGASDRSASLHSRQGLDAAALADFKSDGSSFRSWPDAAVLPTELAQQLIGAELVVDATSTDVQNGAVALGRARQVLRSGHKLVLASKDALCCGVAELLQPQNLTRLGLNAVLGGTGLVFQNELSELRTRAKAVALVGNASTTAIIEAIEAGQSVAEGIAAGQAQGVLEPDPELDLSGTDAATKLAIVVGALWRDLDVATISRQHILDLDVEQVRARRRRGQTTRLVARASVDGEARVAYEAVSLQSPLCVPSDRVAYTYELADGQTRVHVGDGIGPDGTARAILQDILTLR